MTREEMRFLRREIINDVIWNSGYKTLRQIIIRVQTRELLKYGQELKVYG